MLIYYLQLKMHLPDSHSLKEKRGVLKSMIKRMSDQFNISILETDHQDIWQTTVVSFAWLVQNQKTGQQQLEEIRKFISYQYPQLDIEKEVLEIL